MTQVGCSALSDTVETEQISALLAASGVSPVIDGPGANLARKARLLISYSSADPENDNFVVKASNTGDFGGEEVTLTKSAQTITSPTLIAVELPLNLYRYYTVTMPAGTADAAVVIERYNHRTQHGQTLIGTTQGDVVTLSNP